MLRNCGLALLSALLVSAALAPLKLGFLCYWALVPYLVLIRDKSGVQAFTWSFITGLMIAFSTIHLTAFATFEEFMNALTLNGLYFGCLGLATTHLHKHSPVWALCLFPFLWIALEFVRTVSGLGMTATNLAYTHFHYLPVFEGIFRSGFYGISLWLGLVNVTMYLIFEEMGNRKRLAAFLALAIFLLVSPWYLSRFVRVEPGRFEDSIQSALAGVS